MRARSSACPCVFCASRKGIGDEPVVEEQSRWFCFSQKLFGLSVLFSMESIFVPILTPLPTWFSRNSQCFSKNSQYFSKNTPILFFAEKALATESAGFQAVAKIANTRVFARERLSLGKYASLSGRFVRKVLCWSGKSDRAYVNQHKSNKADLQLELFRPISWRKEIIIVSLQRAYP